MNFVQCGDSTIKQQKERKILNCSTCKVDHVQMYGTRMDRTYIHIGHVAHFEAVEHVSGFLWRFTCSFIHSFLFSICEPISSLLFAFSWHGNTIILGHRSILSILYRTTFLGQNEYVYVYNKFMHIHIAHYHRYYHRGSLVSLVRLFSYVLFFIHSFSFYLFQVMSMRLLCILLVNSTEWNMNAHFISKLYLTFTYKLSLAILDNLFDFLAFLFALSPNLVRCVSVLLLSAALLFCSAALFELIFMHFFFALMPSISKYVFTRECVCVYSFHIAFTFDEMH